MDSYREHTSDFDLPVSESAPAGDVAAAIGTDERRMHVRAYNYWVSLLEGRDFPAIDDLQSSDVEDFAGHSVLLDFTCGHGNPSIPYIGAGIRDECGLTDDTRTISDVPPPFTAVAPDRPLSADHRQPRPDRLRSRIREPARERTFATAGS